MIATWFLLLAGGEELNGLITSKRRGHFFKAARSLANFLEITVTAVTQNHCQDKSL